MLKKLVVVMLAAVMITGCSNKKVEVPSEPNAEVNVETNVPSADEVEDIVEEPTYTEEDLRILANVIYFEGGYCTDRFQQLVAQVILNRVADERFPSTVKEVVEQPGQYAKRYIETYDDVPQRCYDNALEALEGRVECPPDVIYQANFKQGTGVYEVIYTDTGWWSSTSYFCYG